MNLQVAIADVADCQKELTIEIGASEVQEEYNKVYNGFARYAKVPGFREGKAPRAVIKQRFGKEIKSEVMKQLVPHALGHVIEDHKLRVIGDPSIESEDINVKEGEPLKFVSRVYVLPEFELKDYKGLRLTKRIAQVTDEGVEQVIEELRNNAAQLVPVEDRPSQAGDFVSVNLVGKYIEPEQEEEVKSDDLMIELGAEGVHPEFNENLTGVKEGDVREFTVKYADDFPSEGLAGKTLAFTATVNAVKIKELPELDDEFAEEIAEEYGEEYTTLEAMRAQVRENLIANADAEADASLRDHLLSVLVKDYDFPLPEPLVDRQANSRLQNFLQQLFRSGMPPQAMRQINWEERQEMERKNAITDVRIALILGKIAEAEQIVVTQEDLDEEIERIAEAVEQSPEQVEARLTKEGGMSSIESRLRSDKVIDFLVSQAEITTEEFDPNQATEQAANEPNPEKAEGAGESA
ncbi:MAG TPA: trigger factor [Blastocatellia bacterium]|nr:trigger factor [Blastocatellia bacterium]